MDALDDLLAGARVRDSVVHLTLVDEPWSVSVEDHATLSLMTPLRGSVTVNRPGSAPAALAPRDIAVVTGHERYVVSDRPGTAPQLRVPPGGRCEPMPGAVVDHSRRLGARTYGARPDGRTAVVSGSYPIDAYVGRRLLRTLPPVLVVPAANVTGLVIDLAHQAVERDAPGHQAVLDRWLDLALTTTLQAWFARPGSRPSRWHDALADPVVGSALRLLHEDPAHRWTVNELARRCGTSRAGLTRRFAAMVGEAPMAYLTEYRITQAADLLLRSDDTLRVIAGRVGYADAFTLSTAFKRLRGTSPSEYRRAGPPFPMN
ncbi:MAG: AraC family transcriptional regulator [Phycicoccus sp.]